MELGFHHFRNPLLHSSHAYNSHPHPQFRFFIPLSRRRLHRSKCSFLFRAVASSNDDDSVPLWHRISRSLKVGSKKFLFNFTERLKKETGLDTDAKKLMEGVVEAVNKRKEAVDRIRLEVVPAFVNWNRWENWKEPNKWESKRIGALILYCIIIAISCQQVYATIESYAYRQSTEKLVEAYMEAVIPEPTPANVQKFKKVLWRKTMPKGLIVKKFIEGPGETYIQDPSFVGEDAWDDDIETSQGSVCDVIDKDTRLSHEQKEEIKEGLGFSERQEHGTTWQDRMRKWNEILAMDQLNEQIDSRTAKYVADFDMNELEKSLRKDVEKAANLPNTRALWISKRWWCYRPNLPYMYFLEKLDSSQVAAVVFEENLKRVYVTMKEGFPLEYIVDIPLDPYMFESITSSDAEVDLLQKTELHYLLKVVIAFMPGLIILYLLKETVMLLRITSSRFLYKQYNQLFDMAYSENFFLPDKSSEDVTSMYNEVILSGDAWDIVDQIMIYMNNPMRYYAKKVPFIRGILLSGPPGTGKTLFARTLAKESGLPFVFASGAEFADNEISGPARINRLFNVAKRNAPSFIFVDEIDAIAGRHARNDPRRHETLEALLIQLDGGKKETGFDRFSLREAFIFICATNRPEELDPEFLQVGRIDRQLTFSLPDDKQRVRIFGVHSAGKKLAEDVDFEKLAFRTVGYSGADIRNLVNEAAIMSVRKGHSFITQQDLVDVLDKQLLEGMGVLLTEEEQQKCDATVSQETKRLLAVHEAGHVLLAHLFPQFDWHAFSQLLPGGKETAMSVFYPREEIVDQGYITSGYLKMQMVVAHGGRCAEKIVFGDDVTDGGRDDLEKITKASPFCRLLAVLFKTKKN